MLHEISSMWGPFLTGPADRPFFVLTFGEFLPKEKWLLQTTFAEFL
jgi:hypothetical protein